MTAPPIFITGRFRSGSTMLWSVFDRAPGCHAFYEPCNDNLGAHMAYTAPHVSHRGVADYWDSYGEHVNLVQRLHDPAFGITRLLLEADDDWPALEQYISELASACAPSRAVFQFNRVDFRLPWLRRTFPEATIVHLKRDRRDSWDSLTRHLPDDWLDDPLDLHVYDLTQWSMALAYDLPFLLDPSIASLYERHSALWRLSELAADRCSDLSLSLEHDFLDDPLIGLKKLVDLGALEASAAAASAGLIEPAQSAGGGRFVPAEGFDVIDERVEARLDALGLTAEFGRQPLLQIRANNAAAWDQLPQLDAQELIDRSLVAYAHCRGEVTGLLHAIQQPQPQAA